MPTSSPYEAESLADLLHRARSADWAAWRDLDKRFGRLLIRTARGIGLNHSEAADVAQLTWLRLWEHCHHIRDPERLASWLAVTARREGLRVALSGRHYVLYADPTTEHSEGMQTAIRDVYPADGDYEPAMESALARLPAQYAQLIRLLMSDNCPSYAEIARAMGVPIGSIGPMRMRALGMLRQMPELTTTRRLTMTASIATSQTTQSWREYLGPYGIWRGWTNVSGELAAFLERLGFGTLWLGGSPQGDLVHAEMLLDATSTMIVATGIVNMWDDEDPAKVAAAFARVNARHPGRFLLGVGVGHREASAKYARPYTTTTHYLNVLLGEGVPADKLVLAALGPKMLMLAADRTAGAHTYLVPTEHTRRARELIGPGPLLTPDQKVLLEPTRAQALAIGWPELRDPHLAFADYRRNFQSLGWSEEVLLQGGSEDLVDAVICMGDADDAATRINEHLDVGADHVSIRLLTVEGADPRDRYVRLARALQLPGAG